MQENVINPGTGEVRSLPISLIHYSFSVLIAVLAQVLSLFRGVLTSLHIFLGSDTN